jgi:hypothetical protein
MKLPPAVRRNLTYLVGVLTEVTYVLVLAAVAVLISILALTIWQ